LFLPHLASRSFGFAWTGDGRLLVTAGGSSWRDVTPPRLRGTIADTAFLDRAHGWVKTSDCVGSTGVVVYRTRDAGASWRTSGRIAHQSCHAGSYVALQKNSGTTPRIEQQGRAEHWDARHALSGVATDTTVTSDSVRLRILCRVSPTETLPL